MVTETDIQQAAQLISDSRKLAVLTGAGISKESGIPTFREAQTGLWAQYDPQELATPTAFVRDPDLVWSWYMWRRGLVTSIKPNPGHYALASLEDLLPEVVILTQNIDGLHKEVGSTDVVELHGNIRRYKCFDDCQGAPTHVDLDAIAHNEESPPPCPHCGAHIRPDVVWFTESLPEAALGRAFAISQACDVMLVVGTSGAVQPAASLPYRAKQAAASLIDVNPTPSEVTPVADVFLQGPSGEVLPRVVEAIKRVRGGD